MTGKIVVGASDLVGYECLKYLVDNEYNVGFLILAEDDPGEYNYNILNKYLSAYPDNEYLTIDKNGLSKKELINLSEQNFDIGMLLWFPYILKKEIINIPKNGWINTHPSLLPFSRGKHTSFWTIVDNSPAGVTIHKINENIDEGDILIQKKIPISWEDTGEILQHKMQTEIINLFKDNCQRLVLNIIPPKKQNQTGTYHNSSEISNKMIIKLDEATTARQVLNTIRAKKHSKFDGAYFFDGNKKYNIDIKITECI